MPLDIKAHVPKSITARKVHVLLEAYDEDEPVYCDVEYDPARYNADIEATITEDVTKRPAITCREVLTTFVTSWDLEYEGEPIEPTVVGLRLVPLFEVQVPIVNAIVTDMGELGKSLQPSSPTRSSTAKGQRRK